jgi:hypothetical protein
MKKFVIPMMALLMAGPAFARVDITCEKAAPNQAIISYSTDEGNVRAFALELSVDLGVITAVECRSCDYYIFPGTIEIEGGEVSDWGTCAATGLDTNTVIVEMASLYAGADPDHQLPPTSSGELLKVTVTEACTLCIAENAIRGGVVMEDPNELPEVNISCCDGPIPPCFPKTYTTYPDFETYRTVYGPGAADCWCAPPYGSGYQCKGDADGALSGFPFYYRVYTGDLSRLVNSWKKMMGDAALDPCADYDHKDSGFPFYYRVYTGDLSILINNWKKTDAQLGIPGPCPMPE